MKTTEIIDANVTELFDKISALIEEARQRVLTTANIAEVYTKYNVGRYIVEDEQEGNYKAGYGKQVLKQISKKLGERFGEGWSVDTLERCRKFYTLYSQPAISATVLRKLESMADVSEIRNTVAEIQSSSPEPHKFVLSWSHYLILMRVKDAVYDFMNSTLTGYLNTNPEVVQQLLERISKSRDYRLQLQKYISLSQEELVDIWNETIISGTTGTL